MFLKGGSSSTLPFQRLQENANLEDIVRFFDGYELMGNPVTVLKTVSGCMQSFCGLASTCARCYDCMLQLHWQPTASACAIDHCPLKSRPLQAEQSRMSTRRSQRSVAGTLRAVVRFDRTEEAHRALREKQGGYVLNAPVVLRVLQ
jgi:hypothetical protein